jgi:hypothetical protein
MKLFGYAMLMFSIFAAPAFAASDFTIPSDAKSSGDLVGSSHWTWTHDAKTPGDSVASSHYPEGSPSLDGKAREFYFSYSNKGGERFSLTFEHNAEVTHFVYDTYVYIDDPAQLANLELDMNQVMSDGKTVIYAFQCSGNSGQWEYSTIEDNSPHWHTSGLPCSPRKWAANKWHHIQIASHRNSSGDVTYDWVNLDGDYKTVNKGGNGAIELHWSPGDLNLNFQMDGDQSRGSVKMYADKLIIYFW